MPVVQSDPAHVRPGYAAEAVLSSRASRALYTSPAGAKRRQDLVRAEACAGG